MVREVKCLQKAIRRKSRLIKRLRESPEKGGVRHIHTIPLNDKSLHSAQITCRCSPLLKDDGVVLHNAYDSREKFERQNIQNVSDGWVLIEENF